MNFDSEVFNLIAAGDRLMNSALDVGDVAMKLVLLAEAKRCYKSAGIESMVQIIDKWLPPPKVYRGPV